MVGPADEGSKGTGAAGEREGEAAFSFLFFCLLTLLFCFVGCLVVSWGFFVVSSYTRGITVVGGGLHTFLLLGGKGALPLWADGALSLLLRVGVWISCCCCMEATRVLKMSILK